MAIKIEQIEVEDEQGRKKDSLREFTEALRDLEPKQSFIWELASSDRVVLQAAKILLNRDYTHKGVDGKRYRIGRTR